MHNHVMLRFGLQDAGQIGRWRLQDFLQLHQAACADTHKMGGLSLMSRLRMSGSGVALIKSVTSEHLQHRTSKTVWLEWLAF